MDGTLIIALHHHRHGVDVHAFRLDGTTPDSEFTEDHVIAVCDDYDPATDHIEWEGVSTIHAVGGTP